MLALKILLAAKDLFTNISVRGIIGISKTNLCKHSTQPQHRIKENVVRELFDKFAVFDNSLPISDIKNKIKEESVIKLSYEPEKGCKPSSLSCMSQRFGFR